MLLKYDFYLNMNERRSETVLLKKIRPNSTVLEFGCYTGIMTGYMKNYLGCKVYVCEIDPQALQYARPYAERAWQGNIETLEWLQEFQGIQFDYILFADVLEHLRNPELVLQSAGDLLKEGGSVLLSVPNVAHNSIIYGLLHNQFEYTEFGLLDKTHLRFYTYYSLKELCQQAGYTTVEEDSINEYFKPPTNSLQELSLNKDFGNIFQFLFELKKSDYVTSHNIPMRNKLSNNAG